MVYCMYALFAIGFCFVLTVKAFTTPAVRFRKREVWSVAFNPPSASVLLSDLKREERERQMDEIFGEMLRVSRLISIFSAAKNEGENLPSDGMGRLLSWQDSLRAKFNFLAEEKAGGNANKAVPQEEHLARVIVLRTARVQRTNNAR
ncbi:hypothetical protein HYT45_02245 [Candidatus Uhrbacteria bacterium]|nr:hypothetical protein [Candidatus Uhrbacteria bacterium]